MSEEKQEVKNKVKRDEFGDVEEEKTEVKRKTDYLTTLFLPFLFVIFIPDVA